MKKLLLLLLVPVLVLGVMVSCGSTYDGDPNPISLQGAWAADNDSPMLVISGNQITIMTVASDVIGNITFRTNYSGDTGDNDSGILNRSLGEGEAINDEGWNGGEGTIEFFWFDGNNDLIGSIDFIYRPQNNTATPIRRVGTPGVSNDFTTETFEIKEVRYETWFHNVMLPSKGSTYCRLLGSSN